MSGQFDPHELQSAEERAASEAWAQFTAEDEGFPAGFREPLSFSPAQVEAVYETTRDTLEQAGIPFLRAHQLAERILTAVRAL